MDNYGYTFETQASSETPAATGKVEAAETVKGSAAETAKGSAAETAKGSAAQPADKSEPRSAKLLSLPARIGLWTVGSAVGVTLLFACVLVWIGGLQYLGAIDRKTDAPVISDGQSEVGPSGGGQTSPEFPDDYSDFFDDYYDFFFGLPGGDSYGGGSSEDDGDTQPQSEPSPGLGIKVVALELEFTVDDKYTAGLVIDTIEDYSSFVGTQVQVNDMIVAADGEATPTVEVLKSHFTAVGDELTLTIARYTGGVASTFDVTVKLVEMQ